MKVQVFSVKKFEQDLLEAENQNKHQLKFDAIALCQQTVLKAKGSDAVIVFTNDDLSSPVIGSLASIGVKFILTRSVGTDHIDLEEAERKSIKVLNVPAYSPQAVAEHAVALAMALSRKLVPTYDSCRKFDFRIEGHIGFNFYKKTVGLIGLGKIGQAAAAISQEWAVRFLDMTCWKLMYPVFNK